MAAREADQDARKRRARAVLRRLKRLYPRVTTALHHRNALELLVATILSAQCTDERVNQVTPELFRRYRTAADYARADLRELERIIRPTGFYRNKARALKALGQALEERFGGEVPDRLEDLVTLPGVGRKTANVVLGTWFGKPGIAVDTHVRRVARRLGLTDHDDPVKIERDLMALFPKKDWSFVSHALIWHGRLVCKARKPACERCELRDLCPYPKRAGT